MKKLFISFLFFPVFALASPVTLNFNGVSLTALSQQVYKNMLHADYVISPEVLAMDRRVSMSVASIDESKVQGFVEGLLKQQGISVDFRDGVYYLLPSSRGEAVPVPDNVDPSGVLHGKAGSTSVGIDQASASLPPVGGRQRDDESVMYEPQNRPADFLAAVVSAAFGQRTAVAVGSGVLLTGSKDDLSKMRQVLDSVDAMPKLVDVSASWVEVTDNASDGRGISLMANFLGSKLGASLGKVNSGSAVSIKSSRFELVIDALKTDTRFKQISSSRLLGDDYEKLKLIVGDETPTISSSGTDNAGNPVQNIVYRPSGVIVDVLPKVLGNGRIKLDVDGQISNFKATSTGVTSSPTLIKRQVKTQVTVVDGEVLLIGGLNDRQSSNTSSALSFLPDWASRSNTKAETDLVLVLSAKVVKQ